MVFCLYELAVNTTPIYNHSNVRQIREAIERRNQQLSATVQEVATKMATVPSTN
jgi:hypothetical protein